MASASAVLKFSREACEGARRPPSLFLFGAGDIYGKGIRLRTPQEAAAEAGKYKNDRALLRARVRAGLDLLMSHEANLIP
jgi:hypothetical protein